MAVMHEISALCRWNIRGFRSRLRNASVVLVGFLAVVLVFVAVLSVRDGILQSETRPAPIAWPSSSAGVARWMPPRSMW